AGRLLGAPAGADALGGGFPVRAALPALEPVSVGQLLVRADDGAGPGVGRPLLAEPAQTEPTGTPTGTGTGVQAEVGFDCRRTHGAGSGNPETASESAH